MAYVTLFYSSYLLTQKRPEWCCSINKDYCLDVNRHIAKQIIDKLEAEGIISASPLERSGWVTGTEKDPINKLLKNLIF